MQLLELYKLFCRIESSTSENHRIFNNWASRWDMLLRSHVVGINPRIPFVRGDETNGMLLVVEGHAMICLCLNSLNHDRQIGCKCLKCGTRTQRILEIMEGHAITTHQRQPLPRETLTGREQDQLLAFERNVVSEYQNCGQATRGSCLVQTIPT